MPSSVSDEPLPSSSGAVLTEWARWLVEEQIPVDDDLAAAVQFADRAVPHSQHAALTRYRPGMDLDVLAATSDIGPHMTALQQQVSTGPGLDAAGDERPRHVDDFGRETRWPELTALVLKNTPVRSMVAFPVRLGGEQRGAFAVYSTVPGAFTDVDLGIGRLLAGYLSAVAQLEVEHVKVTQLETALDTSRRIGAAMGILMFQELLTFDQAFDRLRSASQRLHRKLRDIAADVVDTGQVPG